MPALPNSHDIESSSASRRRRDPTVPGADLDVVAGRFVAQHDSRPSRPLDDDAFAAWVCASRRHSGLTKFVVEEDVLALVRRAFYSVAAN